MTIRTMYEVYPKRAIYEPLDTLPVMDRENSLKKARDSARKWGAVVVKIQARVLQEYPLRRDIITWAIVFVHKPRKVANDGRDAMTRRQLMGKLRQNSKSLYRGFRR